MEASIEDVLCGFANRSLSCKNLVRAYLDRIAAYDKQGPCLNAILSINRNAMALAERLDAAYLRNGLGGSLHGVPIVLKDNLDTVELPTTGGSAALAGMRPRRDAFVVSRLRRAGAVILAKTNLHELALSGTTVSSLGGQTLNPYDLTRTPGGSSGGTAVAVAANMAVAGLGTDTLNSIRSPASANALVGIRPTRGLVSRTGVIPVSETQDAVGPIARSVGDACRLLQVMAGFDPADPSTAGAMHADSYSACLTTGGLLGARIGVFRTLFGTDAIHDPVNKVMEQALDVIRSEGATVVDVDESDFDADELIANQDVQDFELKQVLNSYLAAVPDAPIKCLADILASGKYHKATLEQPLLAAENFANGMEEPEYKRRLARNRDIRDRLMSSFDRNRLDAIVYPLQKRLVVPLAEPHQVDRNGVVAAITGFPAITVPAGFSPATPTAPIGVPVGIELLGRPWSEGKLIRMAHSFEQAAPCRRPPTSTPPIESV
jgi:Asp-tRNA(Asn)/Glu-tRNA(Gln) amidotransferase A subunit family amidase